MRKFDVNVRVKIIDVTQPHLHGKFARIDCIDMKFYEVVLERPNHEQDERVWVHERNMLLAAPPVWCDSPNPFIDDDDKEVSITVVKLRALTDRIKELEDKLNAVKLIIDEDSY